MTVGCFAHRNGSTPRQGGFLRACKTDSVLKNNQALLHPTTPVSTTWQGAGAGRKWILQPVTNPKMCEEGPCAAKCSPSFWGWTVRPWQKPGSLRQFRLAHKVQQHIQPHSLVAPTPPSQDPMVPPPTAWDHPSISHHLCHSWQVAGGRRDTGIKCTKAVQRAASTNKGHERENRAPIFPWRSGVHLPRLKCSCFSLPSGEHTSHHVSDSCWTGPPSAEVGWVARNHLVPSDLLFLSTSHCSYGYTTHWAT